MARSTQGRLLNAGTTGGTAGGTTGGTWPVVCRSPKAFFDARLTPVDASHPRVPTRVGTRAWTLVRLVAALLVAAVSLCLVGHASPAHAAGLEVIRAEAISEFPDGLRFIFEARSEKPIDEVIVRFAVSGQPATQYNYLDLAPVAPSAAGTSAGEITSGEYFHRTGQRDRYVPPAAEFTYFFEVLYEDGSTEETEPATFVAHDSRYEWETLTSGPVTVYYHGPVQRRAEFVADITLQTFALMGPVTGADTEKPVRIVMYNNDAEMIGAVSIRSLTSARQLITEGQAFSQHNLVIVQGGVDRAAGVISHEVTHILVGRAAKDAISGVPVWLNEGLAEYGNLDPGLSYVRYLEWAVDTNRLVPIIYLDNFPADPNLTIVAYGEARSIVAFMIDRWGPQKVADLLAEFNSGTGFTDAIRRVYGFDQLELDRQWRAFLGAKPYEPATQSSLPTPGPQLQLMPFTLDSTPSGDPTPEAEGTPAGEGTTVSTPAGDSTPTAGDSTPSADATPGTPAASPSPAESATPSPAATGGGGCSAGTAGGPTEASAVALLALPLTLLGLRAFRRRY